MSLTALYTDGFSRNSRQKGEEYFQQGRVVILEGDRDRVAARVRGSLLYDVQLEISNGTLNVDCQCETFNTNGYCKHVWATFLAAEGEYLQTAVEKELPYVPLGGLEDELDFSNAEAEFNLLVANKPKRHTWKSILEGADPKLQESILTSGQQLVYVVDITSGPSDQRLVLQVLLRERKLNGDFSKPKKQHVPISLISFLPDPLDVQVLSLLSGSTEPSRTPVFSREERSVTGTYKLTHSVALSLLPQIAGSDRLFVARDPRWSDISPLSWDSGEMFVHFLRLERSNDAKNSFHVRGIVSRESEEHDLQDVDLVGPGLFIFNNRISRFEMQQSFQFLQNLKAAKSVTVLPAQIYQFLKQVTESGAPSILKGNPDLELEILKPPPHPQLLFKDSADGVNAKLSFQYGEKSVVFAELDPKSGSLDVKSHQLTERDRLAELQWKTRFEEMGLRRIRTSYASPDWQVTRARFPEIARRLLSEGCSVYAEGKQFRRSGGFHMSITSGIDWFELHGTANFESNIVNFPELLRAIKSGQYVIELSDGTFGLIPEDWLNKYGAITGIGEVHGDHLRYKMNQASILDALLIAQPEADVDATFQAARDQLRSFEGIGPIEPPEEFVGQLRDYQKEALGWMKFLRDFHLGGCLADDMGLGKTVMVLAMLQSRRLSGEQNPSLIVLPRSLVFNWIQEASRFVPSLRILDYTGLLRKKKTESLADFDVVFTTYGTLRSDAVVLKDQMFDYIILDEAQAVKNAATVSAKAVRLLQGKHRLVLSGTPIQNHLGDLWSLFEFLNPGMLGASSALNLAGAGGAKPEKETVDLLAHALRPFILRRTKEQVLKELPQKVEQTIFCDLTPEERRMYNELRDHYRQSLLSRVDSMGLAKSKIHVLEALLRLRQASCHPGLIDPKRGDEMSTKLETLLPQLVDVLEEGHKALVFSQFVSFLTIVRRKLDAEGISYQYLDGQTKDRQTPVETFQQDPDAKLFLISLKAGGLGLNLTAADYVFLLDPWWNPVIETQAIDRAHRIGQERQVFAYRIIARDTVEEKVLQLQETKRDLADAILTADNSVLRSIQREDLELLLS